MLDRTNFHFPSGHFLYTECTYSVMLPSVTRTPDNLKLKFSISLEGSSYRELTVITCRPLSNLNYNYIYIDRSVLLKNTPFIKFIRNYIRDPSGIFSISSLVRILMTSFPAPSRPFVQTVGEKWRAIVLSI